MNAKDNQCNKTLLGSGETTHDEQQQHNVKMASTTWIQVLHTKETTEAQVRPNNMASICQMSCFT